MDAEDGLVVCHLGVGIWRFDSNCLPTHLVHAGDAHRLMTNIAFKGKTLYITDSLNGEILTAEMPVAGRSFLFLVDLRARALHHLGPLRRVAADERGEFLGRAAAALAAELGQARPWCPAATMAAIDRLVQLVEHRARRTPAVAMTPLQAFTS